MRRAALPDYNTYYAMQSVLGMAVPEMLDSGIAAWNDSRRSKKPVLAAFDKAIQLAEQESA
jgi:hypothetical protein